VRSIGTDRVHLLIRDTERDHAARLRAFSALGILRDEPHLVANRKRVKCAVGNAMAMEIDVVPVRTEDEAAILVWQEPDDPPMVGRCVQLYITPPLANMIFQQAPSSVETVVNGDVGILMRMVRHGIAPDDDLASGNPKIDAHPEQIALLAATVPVFDNHTARCDPIKKAFELADAFAYPRFDCFRCFHVSESDLKWQLHEFSPTVGSHNGDRAEPIAKIIGWNA